MTTKPIPGKAYGSIPHFPGSRMGPADHCCEAGWSEIACGAGRRLAPVADAVELLGSFGRHGAQEKPEGAVYRVETDGRFNFMAKWVDPQKSDGKYLPDISGSPAVIQWPGAASLT